MSSGCCTPAGRFIGLAENAGRVIAHEERHVDSSWCWCTYNQHKMHYMLYANITKKYENKTSRLLANDKHSY